MDANGAADTAPRRSQSIAQVQAILNQPTSLLVHLARTGSLDEQRKLVLEAGTPELLEAMAIPPPSPTTLIKSDAQVAQATLLAEEHPAMTVLLGQAFEPPFVSPKRSGILALAAIEPERRFQPIYTSVDDFSVSTALQQVADASNNGDGPPSALARQGDGDVSALAQQIKTWALEQQTTAVTHQVDASKDVAVSLASQAAQMSQASQANGTQVSRQPFEQYIASYKQQLQALASGYYAQLHQDAISKLGLSDVANNRAGRDDASAKLVQASAAAALAAHSLAANEMIAEAGTQLETAQQLPLPGPQAGLSRLVVRPAELQRPEEQQQRLSSVVGIVAGATDALVIPQSGHADMTTKVDARAGERDQLLAYAHDLYCRDPHNASLLSLLHTLRSQHPRHLPVLLLISCVYYVRGDLNGSLVYNKQILDIQPKYVEAMSNIGTTLRAMGRWRDAEDWWWQAIKIRPTYWDATENLLGVLCHTPPDAAAQGDDQHARLQRALSLCTFVEAQLLAPLSSASAGPAPDALIRPLELPKTVSHANAHRLLNFYYAKGNIMSSLGSPVIDALDEYVKGIEVALSGTTTRQRTGPGLRVLVVATALVSHYISAVVQRDVHSASNFEQVATAFGITKRSDSTFDLSNLLSQVQTNVETGLQTLLALGGGIMPTVLLRPNALAGFLSVLLAETQGMLPSMGKVASANSTNRLRTAYQTLSTLLLTVAKIVQDSLASPASGLQAAIGLPLSPSVLLPIYYLALALCPSPSTCNNLGILLSSLNASAQLATEPDRIVTLTGQQLALEYYRAGLVQDPKHAHLYTNYGSLLKDMGYLAQAIEMYKKAVEFNPVFDVALANLANAVKDNGQIQDSIPYYRRAVALNANFPEAICGLVNALGGVCDWVGRGAVANDVAVDSDGRVGLPQPAPQPGYITQISDLVESQLNAGRSYGLGSFATLGPVELWLATISHALFGPDRSFDAKAKALWTSRLGAFYRQDSQHEFNEGSYLIRLVERLTRRIQRRWYQGNLQSSVTDTGAITEAEVSLYRRPLLPPSLPPVQVPTVLPFHTFTLPVNERQERLISHRTGLRIAQNQLTQPWMPPHVFRPPAAPIDGKVNIGYVSSDLGNHPLSHLMQSVFGLHDRSRFTVFCYATSPSDKSAYRQKIETEADVFRDVASLTTQAILTMIVADNIHILINLSGYTKGARNEIFAARPCPIQMSYMGFAGTLSAGWCDYFIVDPVVCPPSLVSGNIWRDQLGGSTELVQPRFTDFEGDLDPEGPSNNFVYSEKLIYMPHTYFVTDHKQAWHEDDHDKSSALPAADAWIYEQWKRQTMRRTMFPDLPDDHVIFANWNQLYKIDPFVFRLWLKILERHRKSILWLLRFPAAGEKHLRQTAVQWAGEDVANRIVFTDVAGKAEHVHRGRVADLFLDTTECNAHTTAADILYSGTPLLTFPRHRHKLCSRVAASIALATGYGSQMIVSSADAYEDQAVSYARSLSWRDEAVPPHLQSLIPEPTYRSWQGQLNDLRRNLFLTRDTSPLFDTTRWTRNVEKAYSTAWERWTDGSEFEDGDNWSDGPTRKTGCIWVADEQDGTNETTRKHYM